MGGRVGLKGTDGRASEARARGAEPVAPRRAGEMLESLRRLRAASEIHWITCQGPMGSDSLASSGFPPSTIEIATSPPEVTSSEDTKVACREFEKRGSELIVFCGGGGTCRDVFNAVGRRIPILSVPAWEKMHHAVIGVHPSKATAAPAESIQGFPLTGV